MSLLNQLEVIKVHIATVESNLTDLEGKHRKSAAPKARRSIQDCRKLLTDLRKNIMVHVKSIPTKTRVRKVKVSEVDVSEVDVSKPEEVILKPVMKKPIPKLEVPKPVVPKPVVFFKPIVKTGSSS
tara:strand:- start:884 stop:1261 length:378 start_codon:yes stop_codon:yes gene_type:complete